MCPALRGARDVEVMSIDRFEIQQTPHLKWFVVISMGLHIIAMMIPDYIPDEKRIETKHPAVKVKYLPPEKKKPPQKLVDIAKPKKIEKPDSSELIASYDSRAHSNQKAKKKTQYRNKKTVVPRAKKSAAVPKKAKPTPKKKAVPETQTTTIKKPFRPYERGFNLPKKKTEVPVDPPTETNCRRDAGTPGWIRSGKICRHGYGI